MKINGSYNLWLFKSNKSILPFFVCVQFLFNRICDDLIQSIKKYRFFVKMQKHKKP